MLALEQDKGMLPLLQCVRTTFKDLLTFIHSGLSRSEVSLRLCISDMVVIMQREHRKHIEDQRIYWSGRLLNIPIRFWLHSQ